MMVIILDTWLHIFSIYGIFSHIYMQMDFKVWWQFLRRKGKNINTWRHTRLILCFVLMFRVSEVLLAHQAQVAVLAFQWVPQSGL